MGKIIGLGVVAVLFVGGFLYWNSQQGPKAMEKNVVTDQTGVVREAPTAMEETKGMVSSIKDAMGLGKKMQCTYLMDSSDTPIQSTVIMDGQKFKSTTVMGAMTAYMLSDGENQYSWTSASKTGMKMTKACLEKLQATVKDMPKSTGVAPTAEPQDAKKAFDLAKNVQCEPASTTDFTLPTDVTFTDQCALMEQSTKRMQELKDKLPAGVTIPNAPESMQ